METVGRHEVLTCNLEQLASDIGILGPPNVVVGGLRFCCDSICLLSFVFCLPSSSIFFFFFFLLILMDEFEKNNLSRNIQPTTVKIGGISPQLSTSSALVRRVSNIHTVKQR